MSSGKFALINSDFKLTRVDVMVLRQFKKVDEFQKLSVNEIYDLANGEMSAGSIRCALYRLEDREYLQVTKIVQFDSKKSRVYYQLTERVKWLMKFHVGFQEDEANPNQPASVPTSVNEGGQSSSVEERNTTVVGVPCSG